MAQQIDEIDRGRVEFDVDPGKMLLRAFRSLSTGTGAIALLFPFVLLVGDLLFFDARILRTSLSAYYHSGMGDVFVAAVCVVGFILIAYRHPRRRRESWVSLVAGMAMIVLAFFPTGMSSEGDQSVPPPIMTAVPSSPRIHDWAAYVTFVALAAMSLFFAQRSSGKWIWLQRFCAGLIFGALGVGVVNWLVLDAERLGPVGITWLVEVVAIWSFAVSWLVSGGPDVWPCWVQSLMDALLRRVTREGPSAEAPSGRGNEGLRAA
jgi:Protein of unknown function (DUF998)